MVRAGTDNFLFSQGLEKKMGPACTDNFIFSWLNVIKLARFKMNPTKIFLEAEAVTIQDSKSRQGQHDNHKRLVAGPIKMTNKLASTQ